MYISDLMAVICKRVVVIAVRLLQVYNIHAFKNKFYLKHTRTRTPAPLPSYNDHLCASNDLNKKKR